jgi:hypothetical protein
MFFASVEHSTEKPSELLTIFFRKLALTQMGPLLRHHKGSAAKAMRMQRLLSRLEFEADQKAEKQWKLDRLDLVRRRAEKPPTVTQSCRQKIINLRVKTETIYEELYQRKLLELEQQEHIKASRALIEANLTPAERAARDEEVREFQIRYSKLVPEAHPDWRQHASESFRSRKL